MGSNQWVQVNPSLNRDDIIQWFHNISTGNRVYGRTSGTFSDHIHLYYQNGQDSGYNLDPASGEVSKDGNILGDIFALGIVTVAGGVVGASGAVAETAKDIFSKDNAPQISLTGLLFPPA